MPTPSEQLLTRTVYDTDGVTTNWDFAFSGGYLDKSHVKAYIEASTGERTEIIVTEAMLVGPYQVRIAPALAAGLILTVYRDTPKDLPLVDFTDESGFSEIALDTNAKQAVFIAAETVDTVQTSSSYDAEQAASQASVAAMAAQVSATAAAASALLAANEADASQASAVAAAASAAEAAGGAEGAAETVFNANTTAYIRTLLNDATASEARITLGAAASGPLASSGITGAAASGANTDITSITGNAATATNAATAASVPWAGITSKPSTVAGYGISDMASQSVSYANTAGNGGVTSVNGATGAVTVSTAAPTTAQVTSAIAGLIVGQVGSYALLYYYGIPATVGTTVAGANLRYASITGLISEIVPVGTWRCCGYTAPDTSADKTTLFLRVA